MLSSLRAFGVVRALAVLVLGAAVAAAAAAWILSRTLADGPVPINVRWKADVTEPRRIALERELRLIEDHHTEGTTWAYLLTDPSTDSIRRIVQHPSVDDTAHLNRIRFRPEFAYDRTRRIAAYSVVLGAVGGVALLVVMLRRRQT